MDRSLRIGTRRLAAALTLGLSLVLVAGCATLPAEPPPADAALLSAPGGFRLEGRFALRHAGQNASGRIDWRRVGARDEIALSSPFGQVLAELVADDAGARLTTRDGATHAAADGDQLLAEVLGQPFPLARLLDWLRARRDADGIVTRDAVGRPLSLAADGWQVDYDYASAAADALPVRLFARRGDDLELRLRIDSLVAAEGAAR